MPDHAPAKTTANKASVRKAAPAHERPFRAPTLGPQAGILDMQRAAGNRATNMLVEDRLEQRRAARDTTLSTPAESARPLEMRLRSRLEGRFNRSLAGLRIEAGERGREVAEGHRALAVSHDDTIYFGDGAYAPGTRRGDHILRHETAHYLQRQGPGRSGGSTWNAPALEAEAEVAATQASGPIPVAGNAPVGQPLFMKTYVSTVGGNPYLENAVKFYKLWEGETAERIGSYQDIVKKLSGEKKPLPEFRIVSHGNGLNLFLPLLAGAKEYAGEPALGLQTREALATQLGSTAVGIHLSGDMTDDIFKWLQAKEPGKSLLVRLGIGASPTGSLREWMRWAVDEHFADIVKEDKQVQGGPKQTTAAERKTLQKEIVKFQNAIRTAAEGAVPKTAAKDDLDKLRAEVIRQLRDRKWSWTAPAGSLKETLKRMQIGDVTALRRETGGGDYLTALTAVKGWVNGQTYIEIRGCKIGSNDAYLQGIQKFFGSAPDRLPSISAPKLYQFFGLPGVQVLPEGGKAPPVADSLKFLFEEAFDDTSTAKDVREAVDKAGLKTVGGLVEILRHADIKAEFEAWWTMKQRARGVPAAKIQSATLKDFQDFLTTAPPRTFPVNAPGVGHDSLWYLILLPSSAIEALLAWVHDQGYRLPGGEDPTKRFFGGKKGWSGKRFGAGLNKLYVDWLGDTYPVPDKIYFPEDPEYQQNIRKLPGSGKSTGTAKKKPPKPTP